MKVFVGLGNPGKEYEQTRHNIGFSFIDFLARKYGITFQKKFQSEYAEVQTDGEKIVLLKPQTFMNNSGSAVQELMKFYKLEADSIAIAFDDLDIIQGAFKVQKGRYPKVHNGINDIIEKTSSDHYTFIRIGVDERTPELRKVMSGKDYVLQRTNFDFSPVFEAILSNLSQIQI